MRQLLHAAGVSEPAAAAAAATSSSTPPAVLALDAEWQPERKQSSRDPPPAHPVSILQVGVSPSLVNTLLVVITSLLGFLRKGEGFRVALRARGQAALMD